MRAITRGHLARADLRAARQTAERWSVLLAERPDPLDLLIDTALAEDRVDLARTLLTEAEASASTAPGPAQGAAARARIARASGDMHAAMAILVQAIEAHPNSSALRALLAEVMVAAGTAGDARAVLTHLGQPPVNPLPVDEDMQQDGTDLPDAPGSRVG